MSKKFILSVVVVGCSIFVAAGARAEMGHDKKGKDSEMPKVTAKAIIKGTQPDSPIIGRVDLTQKSDGVKVIAHLLNAPAGQHGFHVHENGSCAEAGTAAGGHFNPDQVQHGLLSKDSFKAAHAGDLGNVTIDADGSGYYSEMLKGLNLSEGKYNIAGKAVILHEKVDDFGQPTGNAGGRIGCGIITLLE